MQNPVDSIFSINFIILTGLLLFGCASDPVPTYLPASHPAHPEAAEVIYTAPPNPFKDGIPVNKMPSAETPHTATEPHGDRNSHRMKSEGKKHENSGGAKTEKSGHDHKEHQ